jgi:chromosome segregation ATPase
MFSVMCTKKPFWYSLLLVVSMESEFSSVSSSGSSSVSSSGSSSVSSSPTATSPQRPKLRKLRKLRRREQSSTDALRALASDASRAGLELLGVHGQLHDHLAQIASNSQSCDRLNTRASAADRTLGLLRDGFDALTEQMDQDRESALSTASVADGAVAYQRRLARRLAESDATLGRGVAEARRTAEEAADSAREATGAAHARMDQMGADMNALMQENDALKTKVEGLASRNEWLHSKMETYESQLEAGAASRLKMERVLARVLGEMERLTLAVADHKRHNQESFDRLGEQVGQASGLGERLGQLGRMQAGTVAGVEALRAEVRKNERTMLQASSRSGELRKDVDTALTAVATEMRGGLVVTMGLEERLGSVEAGLDARFGVVSEAIRALSAVVSTST